MNTERDLLHYLEHLWPVVAAVFATIIGMFKMMWNHLNKKFVTTEELQNCKLNVIQHEEDITKEILGEIKELRGDFQEEASRNAAQHQNILGQILRLHSNK